MTRKGIILAGGTGTRLYPVTNSISKQLLPVYDKPMVYYPLSILMLTGLREILIISTPKDIDLYKNLIGNGEIWGLNIHYEVQPSPDGLAQAFLIGENFINGHSTALILGDNIFYGAELLPKLQNANNQKEGATIFAYHVNDPERYGVIEFSDVGKILSIEEKPLIPKSNYAITGLYFYDHTVVEKAKSLSPSKRGELEITDLNNLYLDENKLNSQLMGRGVAWLDTGTHETLLDASQFVSLLEKRQGLKICCPEEIAYKNGWIDQFKLEKIANDFNNSYGDYLLQVLETEK